MAKAVKRPKPVIVPELCKGCGRCIDACPEACIAPGTVINQASGLVPVTLDLSACNACGLCLTACPEPWGLTRTGYHFQEPEAERPVPTMARTVPDRLHPLPELGPVVLKGTYAAAVGAVLAGCRHVYGYPITPSTEGAELMARLLPALDGVFVQAVSEVATVNHLYGCGAAGLPSMTFTSSPGFSLMLEGISYMIGAEVPAVIVNVMRGGPGLGNIGPEQSDIKLMCRGLGHGNTQAIVLAPTTPQEMLDLTAEAFRLAFKYRNPVIVAADGYLGQMTGRVTLPRTLLEPGLPSWAVSGDAAHRRNLIASIYLVEADLEAHNQHLDRKYAIMRAEEQRSGGYALAGAEVLVVAVGTPARMARGAVESLRRDGVPVGLFQPTTLWPFPVDALLRHLVHCRHVLVVEGGPGQLEDELRLALSHAGASGVRVENLRRQGGILPQSTEIAAAIRDMAGEVSR